MRVNSGILPKGFVSALLEIPKVAHKARFFLCCAGSLSVLVHHQLHGMALQGCCFSDVLSGYGFGDRQNLAAPPDVHIPCMGERWGWRHGIVWEG